MADIASQIRLPDYSRGLQGMLGLAGLQGNLLQQRALQQQMGANVATSEAMKQSIDPVSGQIDQTKLIGLLSQDPRAAYNLPQITNQIQQGANARLETQLKEFDLNQKRLAFLNGQLGGLMAKGDNVTTRDIIKTLGDATNLGMMSSEQAVQYAMQIPQNPADLAGWVKNHWISLQAAKDQAALLNPQVQTVDTGGSVNVVPINPMTGQVSGNITALQKSLNPGEAAQRITAIDPRTGQQGTVPLGSTVGPGAQNGGFLPTSVPLGQEKIADAAADRFNSLIEAANNAPTNINGYQRALENLDAGALSGPAADAAIYLPSVLASFGLPAESDTVENTRSLQKYLANAASRAAQNAGYSGSDARLSAFTAGQPDPNKMNPAALRGAINYVMALESGVMAKRNASQAWLEQHGGNTAKLPEFERRWSNAFNPDVMEYLGLPADAQAKYLASMSDEKHKKFIDSIGKMSKVGAF